MTRWSVILLIVMLAGCTSDNGTLEPGTDADGGDTAGQAGDVATGDVTTQKQSDGSWIARRTETGQGPFAAGDDASASTVNGDVTIDASASGGFRTTANLWARGSSEQEAKDRLATLRLTVDGAHVAVESSGKWNQRGGSIALRLPTRDVGDIDAETTNGAVLVDDLDGDDMTLSTTNGRLDCDVQAKNLDLSTTNGPIDCGGDADDLDVDTTNAAVTLEFKAKASGDWDIRTTNGPIDLTVTEDSSRGYDMQADTTNGQVAFDLDDTEEVDSSDGYTGQSRHERTRSYDGRAIQTSIDLGATNGSIDVDS